MNKSRFMEILEETQIPERHREGLWQKAVDLNFVDADGNY
uniref:Uncharacterized protein n=1 Tax=viral metagenome TaxID=1070528 RepID=A0A6M3JFB7_9ZZZZ